MSWPPSTALPAEIDAGRLAIAGHSAGGHLALLAAARLRVRGVLAQAPVCDLRLAAELGACAGAVERLLAQGAPSPIDDPPDAEVLLVHGDADEDVPVALSRRYAAGGHASTSSSSAAATWSTSIPPARPAGSPATGCSGCSPAERAQAISERVARARTQLGDRVQQHGGDDHRAAEQRRASGSSR